MKSSFQVAKFGILLSASVVLLFISCKKDTSTEKILVKPVALPATNYTPASFTANWELNGAVSYNLYVATDSMFVNPVNGFNPKSVSGDSANLSGLPSNTSYYYRVTAVNDKGQETIPSNIIAATTPDPQADRYVYVGSEDKNLYCLYAGTGDKVWTFGTAGDIESSATISAGVLYFSSTDQRLYAIDPIAGTSKWGFLTGGASISSPCSGVDGVYISSYSGFVYGVNLNGSKKWAQQPAGASHMFSSPTYSNGLVYIGGQDNNLYAYDAESGNKVWSAPTGDSISSSPAVSNGIVYVGSFDKSVYAFDAATGAQKWKVGTSDSVLSSPTVSNGIVYVGSYDGYMYALDAQTGTLKWKTSTGGRLGSSPSVSNGVVYEGCLNNNLYAFDATTGAIKWTLTTGGRILSSPTVSGNVVYVGNYDDNLYAVNATTGTVIWKAQTGGAIRLSSPTVLTFTGSVILPGISGDKQ